MDHIGVSAKSMDRLVDQLKCNCKQKVIKYCLTLELNYAPT